MHKPITSRIRCKVDGLLVYCHGNSEFEFGQCTLLFFISVFVSDFTFLLVYLFRDIILNHFQTILVAKYCFNDCKQGIPY